MTKIPKYKQTDYFFTNILDNIENLNDLVDELTGYKVEIYDMRLKFFKSIVKMVDCGLIEYTKRTTTNDTYWWYEVDTAKREIDKKIFTADLCAFKITTFGYICKILQPILDDNDGRYFINMIQNYREYNTNNEFSYFQNYLPFYINTKGFLSLEELVQEHFKYIEVLKTCIQDTQIYNLLQNDYFLQECQDCITKKKYISVPIIIPQKKCINEALPLFDQI